MKLWPVCIIAFFVIFVAGMVTFVVWSTHQREDLVASDYYAREIRHQHRIDAASLAAAKGLVPKIAFDAATRSIGLHFPAGALKAATGTVTLYRPSAADLDRTCELKTGDDGVQRIAAADLKPGLWRVKAEWQEAGQSFYAENAVVIQ